MSDNSSFKHDDGGSAFPITYSEDAHGNPSPVNKSAEDYGTYIHSSGGMSLRDWFAGQALVGLLANPAALERGFTVDGGRKLTAAEFAYYTADALIAQRKI